MNVIQDFHMYVIWSPVLDPDRIPMPPLPPLPKSELEIARIVWELKEATVRQVVDALPAERNVDFWTVQTYLRRLAEKGYLRVERRGRANVYKARRQPGR